MRDIENLGTIWVCVCCLHHHANGECGCQGNDENAHTPSRDAKGRYDGGTTNGDGIPLSRITRGYEVAMGMSRDEHECHSENCASLCDCDHDHGCDCDGDDECECERNTFSHSQCEGCGSYLYGEREAMTLFKVKRPRKRKPTPAPVDVPLPVPVVPPVADDDDDDDDTCYCGVKHNPADDCKGCGYNPKHCFCCAHCGKPFGH